MFCWCGRCMITTNNTKQQYSASQRNCYRDDDNNTQYMVGNVITLRKKAVIKTITGLQSISFEEKKQGITFCLCFHEFKASFGSLTSQGHVCKNISICVTPSEGRRHGNAIYSFLEIVNLRLFN